MFTNTHDEHSTWKPLFHCQPLLIYPLVFSQGAVRSYGYPCFTTSWEAQGLVRVSQPHGSYGKKHVETQWSIIIPWQPHDRRCSENILISVSKPTGHRGEQIHLHWFVQSILSALARSWVETWTTWTTFFWAVCFPDLDYLRFTENSGSNMQKFIEIMWRLILWVDHWIGPRSRAKWSMYWKWKEPNAKDTMNHWTQSVAQFEIQFFVTSYGFIVHLFHSQIAIIYWSSKPFPRRILQGGAHPVISWFINHYNPHQL